MADEAVVATFARPWDAELARQYLDEAGIPAWVQGSHLDQPDRAGPIRLVVPVEWEEEAHLVLSDAAADGVEEEPLDSARRRPLWVTVVAGLVVAGLVITAVPRFLWVPLLILSFFGLLLWQLVRPAPPGRD